MESQGMLFKKKEEKKPQVPAFVMSPMVPALPIAAVVAVTALLPKNLPVSVYM